MKLQFEMIDNIFKLEPNKQEEILSVMQDCFSDLFKDNNLTKNLLSDTITIIAKNKQNQKTVGFAIVETSENVSGNHYLKLNYLGVGEEYRNKGIATQLIDNVKEFAKTQEFEKVYLNCSKSNSAKYLYFDNNFNIENNSNFCYIMVSDVDNKYQKYSQIAYEIIKIITDNDLNNVEDVVVDMIQNKKYDNLYQYNLNDKEIEKIILKDKFFPIILQGIDDIANYNNVIKNTNSNYNYSDTTKYLNLLKYVYAGKGMGLQRIQNLKCFNYINDCCNSKNYTNLEKSIRVFKGVETIQKENTILNNEKKDEYCYINK